MKQRDKLVKELLKAHPDCEYQENCNPGLVRSVLRQFTEIYSDDKHKIIRAAATVLATEPAEGVLGVYRAIETYMGKMSAVMPDKNNSIVISRQRRMRRMAELCRRFKYYFPDLKATEDSFLESVLAQCEEIYPGHKRRVFIVAAIAIQLCSDKGHQAYRDELARRTRERDLAIQASGNGFLQLTSWFNPDLRARMRY